jgi:hypothetical protein
LLFVSANKCFEQQLFKAIAGRWVLLKHSVHDPANLLAKKFGPAGGGMTNSMGFDIQFF